MFTGIFVVGKLMQIRSGQAMVISEKAGNLFQPDW